MNAPGTDQGKALTANGESSLTEAEITLGVLTAIEENHAVTQRSIASGLGIALGLTNAYLRRCIKKGYVKVTQIPRNRYAYYVTPTGFAEKSRLTAFYLSQSFRFFREARGQCEEAFETCVARNWNRVVLVGVGDLGEIAYYCGRERPIELLGFLDPDHAEDSFLGLAATRDPAILARADAAVVTDMKTPQAAFDFATVHIAADRILTPGLLNISRHPVVSNGETPS